EPQSNLEPCNDPVTVQLNLACPDSLTSASPCTATLSDSFQIPWHKLPSELIKALNEKKRPMPALRREMIRIVVDDLLASGSRPGRTKLRHVAQQIVERFPKSFSDVSGDIIVGSGYDSLMLQMENRVENCLRQTAQTFSRQAGERAPKKPKLSDKYGCVEWQPFPPVNDEDYENKRTELCNSHKENLLSDAHVKQLMKETYYRQRLDINNENTNVNTLMEKWPYLFEASGLFDHCETLIGFAVQVKLAEELSKKGQVVKDFIRTREASAGEKMNQGPLEMLRCLTSYFKEKTEVLLVANKDGQKELPRTPCIIVIDEHRFKVAVDQVMTIAELHCPLVALAYMFSMFYLMNIKYPKEAALTLEFIQRGLLGINPERGSKAESKCKKHYKINPKLLKFLTDLSDFQNPFKI
ncbi:hypothetical protein SRHO_G00078860, partial [Serrasalmus rhombeus]